MARAFTRAVSPRIAECELTHRTRDRIDPARAMEQHAAYEQALMDAGLTVERLPELPGHPDAVFVEDTAVLLGDHAIVTRPGAATRAREVDSTAQSLADRFTVHRLERGHVDGGDVLRVGRRLYVGLSTRSDRPGIAALAELARPLGFEVVPTSIGNCLHLKTAATLATPDLLLYNAACVDPAQFSGVETAAVAPDEPDGANVVMAGATVLAHAGNPRTADMLRGRGLRLVEVDVSELEKAEAGVTCMSLIDDRP